MAADSPAAAVTSPADHRLIADRRDAKRHPAAS